MRINSFLLLNPASEFEGISGKARGLCNMVYGGTICENIARIGVLITSFNDSSIFSVWKKAQVN